MTTRDDVLVEALREIRDWGGVSVNGNCGTCGAKGGEHPYDDTRCGIASRALAEYERRRGEGTTDRLGKLERLAKAIRDAHPCINSGPASQWAQQNGIVCWHCRATEALTAPALGESVTRYPDELSPDEFLDHCDSAAEPATSTPAAREGGEGFEEKGPSR